MTATRITQLWIKYKLLGLRAFAIDQKPGTDYPLAIVVEDFFIQKKSEKRKKTSFWNNPKKARTPDLEIMPKLKYSSRLENEMKVRFGEVGSSERTERRWNKLQFNQGRARENLSERGFRGWRRIQLFSRWRAFSLRKSFCVQGDLIFNEECLTGWNNCKQVLFKS